jgi:replicative DNA helicase
MLTDSVGDAELAVLGAVIATAGSCLDDIALTGADFFEPGRGDLFDIMRTRYAAGQHVDMVTMMNAAPGKEVFVASLIDHTPFAYAVEEYAGIVAQHALRRRLSGVGAALAGMDPTLDVATMSERAQALVDEAVGSQKSKVRFVKDILPGVIERMHAKESFTLTPWPTLNAAIGGLRPGAVYVVAARPAQGKTVIAAQLAAGLAEHGMVAFSSLEMTEDELVARLIAERLAIGVGRIKDSRMTNEDWQKLERGRPALEAMGIAIDDRSNVATTEVRTFARSVSRHGKLAGIVVDYMQLMTSKSKMDRHLQVSEFSRQLKIMAKDLHVPVIALSQLNRQSESRADGIPKLSDLRESGSIEQDADVVIMLRREGEGNREEIILDVVKNRHGETGEVSLAWQGHFSRAVEWNS